MVEPAAAMLDTVRTLFPDSSVVIGPADARAAHDFRFVPSTKRPNLVVPASSARAAARTVWRFSVAAGTRDSAARLAAGAVLRLGAGRLTKDAISVDADGDSIVRHLETVFGQTVNVSIAIGSARANRKPVLEVFDAHGRSLAFAKVGVDAVSRRDVEAEATNLRDFRGRAPAGMDVPEVIDESLWQGHVVLVMSALPTRWQRPGVRRRVPVDLMGEFARAWGSEKVALASSPFWARQRERAAALVTGSETSRLRAALDRVEERWGAAIVETGTWHGDWTPWNMAWRRGRLQLWDFERLDHDGLVGLDVLHYLVNETMQRSGVTLTEVARAIRVGGDLLGRPSELADVVSDAYLAAIAVRYQSSAGGERGDLIAGRALFMIEALERQVEGSWRNGPAPASA